MRVGGFVTWRVVTVGGRMRCDVMHGRPPKLKNPFRVLEGVVIEVDLSLICRDHTIPLELAPFPVRGGCCDVVGPVPRSLSIRKVGIFISNALLVVEAKFRI